MRIRSILVLAAVFPMTAACSSSSGKGTPAEGADSGSASKGDGGGQTVADSGRSTSDDSGSTSSEDGGTADSGAPDAPAAATARVRVAHLSPDAPAVDFCIAPHGSSSFAGPVLQMAGNAAGLTYTSVTAYLPVPAAQYDVRLVAPGASSCATSLAGLPDFTSLPALTAGGSFTVAAEGQVTSGGTPFTLQAYVDEATVPSGQAGLRFVHASPGTPAVDVGTGAGSTFQAVFSNVAFGATAASGGGIDADGYFVTAPLSDVELSARAHGSTSDALIVQSASLPAGALATAFAIGVLGSTKTPLSVLLCVDNASAVNGLSTCSVVGDSLAHVRVAHFSPDAPAVDVCVKAHSSSAWPATPLLESLQVTAGLSYPQVTTYVSLPVGSYDLRIVAPAAPDCSTALAGLADTDGVTVDPAMYATVAALGDLTPAGSDPAFALKVFVDDRTVASGKASLRFIHASPGTPAVDVGIGTGASFVKVFPDVAFGQVAAAGAGIDANGYDTTAPVTGINITARLANASTDALTVPGISLAAGTISSAFAIGSKTGATTNPLQVLLCNDSAPPTGVLTTCSAPAP